MYKISERQAHSLWSRVKRGGDDECWPWIGGSKHKFGYGRLVVSRLDGTAIQVTSSRLVCFLANGEPQDGEFALHSCDNASCCNPKHLRWGTQKDNVGDAIERNRHSHPPRNAAYRRRNTQPKGEALHNQSLTEAKVREIWRLHFMNFTARAIAEMVGAKQHVVADVTRGRSWRHLDDAPSIETLKTGGVRRGFNQFSTLPD